MSKDYFLYRMFFLNR